MKLLLSRKHIATTILIVLNAVLYIVMVANTPGHSLAPQPTETLILWGGNYGPLTLTTEPWRILTCTFMHAGLPHLLVNLFFLYSLGKEMEQMLGTAKFLFVYFVAGIVRAIVSVEFQPTLVSVGASGAIFGIFGTAFTAIGVTSFDQLLAGLKRRFIVLLIFIALILLPAFLVPGIDSSAHLGGLIAGLLSGFAIAASSSPKFRRAAYAGMALMAMLPIAAYFAIAVQYKDDLRFKSQPLFIDAEALIKDKKYKEALPLLDKGLAILPSQSNDRYNKARVAMLMRRARCFLELKRTDEALKDIESSEPICDEKAPLFAFKAMAKHRQKRYQEAIDLYKEVLKINPDDPQIHNDLAWSQAAIGKLDDALSNVNKGLSKDNNMTAALDTRGTIYMLQKDYDKALLDLDRAIRLNPKEGAAYFHRAQIELARGDLEKCDSDLKASKESKYETDLWEPERFSALVERSKKVATEPVQNP